VDHEKEKAISNVNNREKNNGVTREKRVSSDLAYLKGKKDVLQAVHTRD